MAARLISALLACSLFLADTAAAGWRGDSSKYKDAILLSNVETLTFHGHGAQTNHRRVSSVPQLKCISHPELCSRVNLDVMRCTNQGAAYGDQDIQWSCTAMLPDEFKLGSTNVICEGYANPDDPYVLKGSCGVEYRVALTDRGEQRYPDLAGAVRRQERGQANTETLFWVVFFAILAFIIWGAFQRYNENGGRRLPRPRRGGRGYWGGGGGGGGGDGPGGWDPRSGGDNGDPPPPYPGTKPSSSSSSSWRPGFWSGLAAGGAGGYAAGRYSGRNNQSTRNDYDYYGGNGGYNGESSSSSSFRSRNSGASGQTHQSTGFGSTSRR